MSTQRYGRGAMLLHWGHAILVLGLIAWGLYMSDLPKGPDRGFAIGVHKSFGIVAFGLIAVRLLWRRFHPAPVDLRLSQNEHALAAAGHHLLYLLLVLTPLAGYLSASFTQYPMRFFGIIMPKAGWPDDGINAFFNAAHGYLAWSLMGLIAVHVAAVVMHAVQKKPVMARMLPGRNPID
jgi:cytochrome b561